MSLATPIFSFRLTLTIGFAAVVLLLVNLTIVMPLISGGRSDVPGEGQLNIVNGFFTEHVNARAAYKFISNDGRIYLFSCNNNTNRFYLCLPPVDSGSIVNKNVSVRYYDIARGTFTQCVVMDVSRLGTEIVAYKNRRADVAAVVRAEKSARPVMLVLAIFAQLAIIGIVVRRVIGGGSL